MYMRRALFCTTVSGQEERREGWTHVGGSVARTRLRPGPSVHDWALPRSKGGVLRAGGPCAHRCRWIEALVVTVAVLTVVVVAALEAGVLLDLGRADGQ